MEALEPFLADLKLDFKLVKNDAGQVTAIEVDPEHLPTVRRMLLRQFEGFDLPLQELKKPPVVEQKIPQGFAFPLNIPKKPTTLQMAVRRVQFFFAGLNPFRKK